MHDLDSDPSSVVVNAIYFNHKLSTTGIVLPFVDNHNQEHFGGQTTSTVWHPWFHALADFLLTQQVTWWIAEFNVCDYEIYVLYIARSDTTEGPST